MSLINKGSFVTFAAEQVHGKTCRSIQMAIDEGDLILGETYKVAEVNYGHGTTIALTEISRMWFPTDYFKLAEAAANIA